MRCYYKTSQLGPPGVRARPLIIQARRQQHCPAKMAGFRRAVCALKSITGVMVLVLMVCMVTLWLDMRDGIKGQLKLMLNDDAMSIAKRARMQATPQSAAERSRETVERNVRLGQEQRKRRGVGGEPVAAG